MIERSLTGLIREKLFKGKAILLTGARQTGKTTLIRKILEKEGVEYLFFDGDDPTVRHLLENPDTGDLKSLLGQAPLVFIDEAQRIPNMGLTAKIITDRFQEKQLILTGSSSFELSGNMEEPLTGRKWSFELYPVSWEEWEAHVGTLQAEQDLDDRLVHGFYPDVLSSEGEEKETLKELVNSYLYKDLLLYAGIRKSDVIEKLVRALAFQVGQEFSHKEVGDLVGLDPKTVGHYIDVLEKAFVLFRLPSFNRNLRNEIRKSRKIYFYDNGVRNAVIGDLRPLKERQDHGALWENFLVSERIKQSAYKRRDARIHFWRTAQQQEIDLVEEWEGKLFAFEFKWNPRRKIRFPKTFTRHYDAELKGISRDNFRDFVVL